MCDENEPQPEDELEDEPLGEFLDDPDQPETQVCKKCMAENEVVKLRTVQNNRCWNCLADFNEFSLYWRF